MTSRMLPSPDQSWAHSTNSLEDLRIALGRGDITAIEADILMGRVVGSNTDAEKEPIMAHPPNRLSSLSTSTFIQLCLDRGERTAKHIKLDFKEIEAVQPTLEHIHSVLLSSQPKPVTVFLNADILPGPGCRSGENYVDSKGFLEACTSFLRKEESVSNSILSFALSLGYKADYRAKDDHYTVQDAEKMASLVRQCELPANVGLVLALNARCLACYPTAFDKFLHEFQDAQILAWTGTGEPAIPRAQIDSLQRHADEHYKGRIGFDCLESYEAERRDTGVWD